MPSAPSATPTPITPPRVPIIDARTGLIDRAWYMFFLSLFTTASNAQDPALGPDSSSLLASFDAELRALSEAVGAQYDAQSGLASLSAALAALEQQFATQPASQSQGLQQQIDALRQEVQSQPGAFGFAPLTKTDDTNVTLTLGGAPSTALLTAASLALGWTGQLAVSRGGTGVSTTPANGQLLIGNGTGYTVANLTQGTGVTITNSAGGISISATGTGGTVTSVSVVSANGFAGTVANATTTPAITLSTSVNGLVYGNATALAAATISAPLTYSAGTLAITQATSSTNGYLSSTDWNTFNNKQPAGTYVTSVTGTSPVVSSGGTTPVISLATAYGDTQNPYASKTANYVLAAPNGSAGAPSFRALVAGDIPSLSYVTSVGATAPITSTGGLTPTIGVTSAALTKTDDTNVTLTLGGSPTTALLAATSLTLGWTGQLAVGRGGLGISTTPSNGFVPIGNGTNYTAAALTAGTGITITNASGAITIAATAGGGSAPITKTANFSVTNGETWYINNKTGSACTVTLPAASSYTGRELKFVNYQAQTLISASSNVVPLGGGSAGTAILAASVGDWATLVSDGTNWIIMQAAANNCLLLE
jgi:hypothetical protein